MAAETVRGKKCPKCSSFIKDGTSKCEICGFPTVEKEKTRSQPSTQSEKAWFTPVICPRCGTGNQADFKFCKMCKHPLDTPSTPAEKEVANLIEKSETTIRQPLSKYFLEFHWLKSPGREIENKLELIDFSPFFIGYTRWDDYAFLVYRYSDLYEMLVRKIIETGEAMLYKRCRSIVVLRVGRIFCLGQLTLQLTENIESANSNKTILIGPGAVPHNPAKCGKGIRITNIAAERDFIEIKEKCRIGRDWIAQQFGLDKEMLRTSGVSREYFEITPLEDGNWLLNPMNTKNLFVAIDEVPESIKEGETLRWVKEQRYGEFQLKIKTGEV
jgi:hypothetical protein